MNPYEEYAKIRSQIDSLTDKKKKLEEALMVELVKSPRPIKTAFGTFSKVKNSTWRFPNQVLVLIDGLKKEITDLKDKSIEDGVAIETEKLNVRFTKPKKDY